MNVCIFMKENLPQDDQAIALYFGCDGKYFHMGYVSNCKPSGIFKINRRTAKGIYMSNCPLNDVKNLCIGGRLSKVSEQENMSINEKNQLQLSTTSAERILMDFCDYVYGFDLFNQPKMAEILENWKTSVESKISKG